MQETERVAAIFADPLENTISDIGDTADYIRDAERLAAGEGR